jgi:hypothetical protein
MTSHESQMLRREEEAVRVAGVQSSAKCLSSSQRPPWPKNGYERSAFKVLEEEDAHSGNK